MQGDSSEDEEGEEEDIAAASSRAVAGESAGVDVWIRPPATTVLSAASPLWEEIEGLVATTSAEVDTGPALDESSPILPITPSIPTISKRLSAVRIRDGASGWTETPPLSPSEEDPQFLAAGGPLTPNRNSTRSSTSTVTGVTTAVVRKGSIARRAVANLVVEKKIVRPPPPEIEALKAPQPSPQSSHFGSSESSSSGGSGGSSSENGIDRAPQTPVTDLDPDGDPLLYYLDNDGAGPSPMQDDKNSPFPMSPLSPTTVFGHPPQPAAKPKITISPTQSTLTPGPLTALNASITPLTPALRYGGWIYGIIKPIEEFIDEPVDPRDYYTDLQEIAEGDSGSVFVATVTTDVNKNLHKLKLPPLIKARDSDNRQKGIRTLVAIKIVSIMPNKPNPKLVSVGHELGLLKGLMHPNVLGMDALYVDLVEDSVWIRMELMERSLADAIELVGEGLVLVERVISRFANDVSDPFLLFSS